MDSVETVVVGAGVVGLAVARALALAGREVLLLEAEDAIGTGTSARNSEVIHAGLYYAAGSLKARLCTEGRVALEAFWVYRPKWLSAAVYLAMGWSGVTAYHAGAGITYAVDILRLVPYFDVSVGLLGLVQPTDKGPKPTFDFGVEIGLGVDYLINRRVAVGFVVRYHAYLTSITQIPVYMYAGPRVAIHWGG